MVAATAKEVAITLVCRAIVVTKCIDDESDD